MASGVFWSFVEKGGNQLASFIVFTFIARLLGPEEYGLISLCYIYTGLVTTFFYCVTDGVVSLKISDDRGLSTLFWSCVGFGVFFALAGNLLAYPIALLFHQPRLAGFMMWFSIVPVLLGFSALPAALFGAAMNFRITAIRTLVATIAGGIVGIILALRGMGAMAMVAQQITLCFVANIVLWLSSSWKPRLLFDRGQARKYLMPGLKSAGVNLVTYAQDQLPRVFLGIFLTPVDVGFYALANRVGGALREIIFAPLSAVVFPALSLIKENKGEQEKILSELILILGILVLPVVAGAIILAPLYVPLFFGESWRQATPVLQLFLLSVSVSPFLTILQSIFRAHNAMGSFFKAHASLVCISLLASLFAVSQGVVAMTACYVFFLLLSLPLYTLLLKIQLRLSLWRDYAKLWPVLLAALTMAGGIIFLQKYQLINEKQWVNLVFLVLAGGAIYSSVLIVFFRKKMMFLVAEAKRFARQRRFAVKADGEMP